MEIWILLIAYPVIMVVAIGAEICLLTNNKGRYLRTSYKALESICKSSKEKNIDIILPKEIDRFYKEYVQEDVQTKKIFPNVIVWLDAVIYRIDCGYKHAKVLKEYEDGLKYVRDELERQNPFNKCEKYQQDILQDISKLKTNDNDIVVQNIVNRTKDEFIRLSTDIKKNERSNKVSITISIVSIIVSIILAFKKF